MYLPIHHNRIVQFKRSRNDQSCGIFGDLQACWLTIWISRYSLFDIYLSIWTCIIYGFNCFKNTTILAFSQSCEKERVVVCLNSSKQSVCLNPSKKCTKFADSSLLWRIPYYKHVKPSIASWLNLAFLFYSHLPRLIFIFSDLYSHNNFFFGIAHHNNGYERNLNS